MAGGGYGINLSLLRLLIFSTILIFLDCYGINLDYRGQCTPFLICVHYTISQLCNILKGRPGCIIYNVKQHSLRSCLRSCTTPQTHIDDKLTVRAHTRESPTRLALTALNDAPIRDELPARSTIQAATKLCWFNGNKNPLKRKGSSKERSLRVI